MSPVFKREKGYVFKIFSNEEERMHIHVVNGDNEAKYWLEPNIELANNFGFSQHELNNIQKIVEQYGNDYFLSYNRIPWMRDASISSVLNVKMSGRNAIEWPDLNVDLEIDSLKHPERYPLIMKRSELDFMGA